MFLSLLLGLFVLFAPCLAWEKLIPPERAIPTLEASLQVLAQAVLPLDQAVSMGISTPETKVQVVVEAEHLAEDTLFAVGAEVRHSAAELGLWEVLVPVENLVALATLPGVRYVRRPHRPHLLGTQGVDLTGARAWHIAGLRGQGVRVAVIDAEFQGLSQAQAQGRLRRVVVALDYTGEGLETGGGHGTACAEIVQDMAPEAELVLMKIANEVQLAKAVDDAIALGVKVITHSMAWFNTSFYDGTGVVCAIARKAGDRGILWVNAAGNFAAGAHWEGWWHDGDGDAFLDFAPGVNTNTFWPELLKPVGFWLTWDAWPATDQDLDLYLIHLPTGEVVASSTTTQAGAQPPTEQAFFVPTLPGPYGVVIHGHRLTKTVRLELFASATVKLQVSVAESSIPSPADAPFVLAVGAIPWRNWNSGPQAPYSSQGPTNASRGNPVQHVKPDLMGPDGVDTLIYGGAGFTGTSAAAPHVAGALALVWSAHPNWTAEQVRFWLEFAAADLGTPGKDNVYGWGRLRLPEPALPSPPAASTHSYTVPGWHLVSVPTVGDKAEIFGATLWHWDGAQYRALAPGEEVHPLRGYWARFPGPRTVTAQGTVPQEDQVLVLGHAGWHIVSSPWPYRKDAIRVLQGGEEKSWAEAVTAGWVRPTLWAYAPEERQYFSPETLEPWRGYWLYARAPNLVLRFRYGASGSAARERPYPQGEEAPPPPPEEGLPPQLQVLIVPNPWRGSGPLRFSVAGAQAVTALAVEIFDLSGRRVWQGSTPGAELLWLGQDDHGFPLANGVYLCVFRVEVAGKILGSGRLKLVILR